MGQFNPFRMAVICMGIALVMGLTDLLYKPFFFIRLTRDTSIWLWPLFFIFACLQFTLWFSTSRKVTLSDEEVRDWGEALAEATPMILDAYASQTSVRDIAEAVQGDHGIPVDVTLRYIMALGHYQENNPESQVQAED
jgi:hypothetical protein